MENTINLIIPPKLKARHMALTGVLLYAILLLLMQAFTPFCETLNDKYRGDQLFGQVENNSHPNLHFSVTDNGVAHPFEKNECTQLVVSNLFKNYKVLRSCVFIIEQSIVLTKNLARFTTAQYRISLPLLWDPSIPIAHRKLVI